MNPVFMFNVQYYLCGLLCWIIRLRKWRLALISLS